MSRQKKEVLTLTVREKRSDVLQLLLTMTLELL